MMGGGGRGTHDKQVLMIQNLHDFSLPEYEDSLAVSYSMS